MIGELSDLNARMRTDSTDIDFNATDRQTKRLMGIEGLGFEIGGRTLFSDLDFAITAGMRVGLVGPNGSGKTTLLRLLRGETEPSAGKIEHAPSLRIVYFDQNRKLDQGVTLRRALAPDSDSVIYQDRVIHVASWAARFLFTSEQLNQPVERLSGGEKARVLIALLMLQPADVLLLDEPTNDLDIPTLEILEESLLEYPGALVLVTHDRYLLDRVSTIVLGLDGQGGAESFADYSQWETWQSGQLQAGKSSTKAKSKSKDSAENSSNNFTDRVPSKAGAKKLSYLETRELSTIEDRVAAAEELLRSKTDALQYPGIASDAPALLKATAELEVAEQCVDELYARWAELEKKQA
ncbi:MAG: hypothetical protein NVS1B11_29610 [Terriglobales bacterium]